MDKPEDGEIIQLTDFVSRMHKCGCWIRRFRNPITDLMEWDLPTICTMHKRMKIHNYDDWKWYVTYFQKRFFEPSHCYCHCHQTHPDGLRNCEECRCWWMIQKNIDAELVKDESK